MRFLLTNRMHTELALVRPTLLGAASYLIDLQFGGFSIILTEGRKLALYAIVRGTGHVLDVYGAS